MQEIDNKFVMIELEIIIQILLNLGALMVQKYLKEMQLLNEFVGNGRLSFVSIRNIEFVNKVYERTYIFLTDFN